MNSPPLICLVTPGHVSSTPRLAKEADALCEAGYRVHVVCGRHFAGAEPLDADLLGKAEWQCTRVPYGLYRRTFTRRVIQRVARHWTRAYPNQLLGAILAQHTETGRFAAAAASTRANLYIGHCVGGLVAAARAAARVNSIYAFDAEDYHAAETALTNGPSVATIERKYLARSSYVTASSPLIADAYRRSYGVTPTVVLNVFSLRQAPATRPNRPPIGPESPARLYWFSQTVGPDRGIEGLFPVLACLTTPAQLNLRGFVSASQQQELDDRAHRSRLPYPIRWLPPAAPAQMIPLAAEMHLGLSLEHRSPTNRNLCLTNKVFTYLAAGIPQLLSPTDAQLAIAGELANAALLVREPIATARAIDTLLGNQDQYDAACATATARFRSRYCWEIERDTFLDLVRRALGTQTSPA